LKQIEKKISRFPEKVLSTPRDLTENQRFDEILESAERVMQDSLRHYNLVQGNRVNPLSTTKNQLKKAWKAKRPQEAKDKQESDRQERLQKIRVQLIEL
jgi:hypothetical protein